MLRTSCKRFCTSLLIVGSLFIMSVQWSYAQGSGDNRTSAPTIDQATGKILNEAIEFLNQDKHNEAKQVLGTLALDRLSPYEKSRVEQILASIEYNQGNYDAARRHMQGALDSGGLNEQEASQARYQIAQMYMADEKWVEGAAAMELWIKSTPTPNSAAYYLLAVAYYQQEKYDAALVPAKKAVDLTDTPQESWIQLLLALLLQKENYKEAIPVLEQLIAMAPEKKTYWSQLSSVYGQLEDYANALAILQLAFHGNLLTEDSEIRRLADMMVLQNAPYRAAQLLTTALEQKKVTADGKLYEKLANCWIASREYKRSLPVLEKAASMSPDGNLYVRLAEVNMQLESWPAVSAALQNALNKGKLRDLGNAQLLMGISLYNQKKNADARTWLQRAASSAATTKNQSQARTANGYIQLIDSLRG